jgi:glycyl-tRNA synthetase
MGVGRLFIAALTDAYDEEEVNGEMRTVLRLKPSIAPIKVAILPLSKKPELTEVAREIFAGIAENWRCEYDDTQSIGRRYRRQDEIGTPLCVTVNNKAILKSCRSPPLNPFTGTVSYLPGSIRRRQ